MSFALPPYLALLPTADEDYAALNTSLHDFVLRAPGEGNLKAAEIVSFTAEHHVYRVYGGSARQCGRWWILDPPSNDTASHFEEFAVCPEWNDASNIVRCTVPVGFNAIVGIGQTVDCANNETLVPEDTALQFNGDVCVVANILNSTCEFCAADSSMLEDSACVMDLLDTSAANCPSMWTMAGFSALFPLLTL